MERIGADLRLDAAALLVGTDGDSPHVAAVRFVENAANLGIDISLLWGAVERPGPSARARVVESCLAVVGSGRAAMLFLSNPDRAEGGGRAEGVRVCSALAEAACGHLATLRVDGSSPGAAAARDGRPAVVLAQALPYPEESGLIEALIGAGFIRLGELAYLRRPIERKRGQRRTAMPAGVEVVRLSSMAESERTPMLLRALEGSYVDTLDCPELCGMRSVEDVLASHRAVGVFDPDLWWLAIADDQPGGCVLLSACPEQRTVELVYVGLAPALRGRGVGEALMRMALAEVAGRGERWVTCAVDTRNTPAVRLYSGLGFERTGLRVPLVRHLVGVKAK